MLAPYTVAAIVRALRHVHGDDIARAMLTNGTTLAALIADEDGRWVELRHGDDPDAVAADLATFLPAAP